MIISGLLSLTETNAILCTRAETIISHTFKVFYLEHCFLSDVTTQWTMIIKEKHVLVISIFQNFSTPPEGITSHSNAIKTLTH